ncbi:MAG: hypothetical protein LBC68_04925 [Prevotellaceae bacterium]|jgi:sulfur transfer complex TusBCD TusB component (DsrH family)|nr:hypothetical protein [Prevotellaceae bacterium]
MAINNDNSFKLKFDGEQHQIDANVLISSLIHTTTIIHEANKYLDSGKKIEIKIKAPEKGSFLLDIELVETTIDAIKNIFASDFVQIGAVLISTLSGLITIKQFLKSKSPKNVEKGKEKTTITNQNGDIIHIDNAVFNIYEKSEVVQDALAQNFEALNNDPAITAFEITNSQDKSIVRVEKKDFPDLVFKSEEIQDDERITTEAATLNIVRLSFESELKWEFYFKGNKISAKIKDLAFQELINKGERFAKGDILEVELQIIQKWDNSVNTYINKSYLVTKIIRHILRDEQQTLKFE